MRLFTGNVVEKHRDAPKINTLKRFCGGPSTVEC
jgi:hypothetical protein